MTPGALIQYEGSGKINTEDLKPAVINDYFVVLKRMTNNLLKDVFIGILFSQSEKIIEGFKKGLQIMVDNLKCNNKKEHVIAIICSKVEKKLRELKKSRKPEPSTKQKISAKKSKQKKCFR
jgi:hypothetical protein